MDSKQLNSTFTKGGHSKDRPFLTSLFAVVTLIGSALLSAPSWAAMITVGGGTTCTLPDAIDAANGDADSGTCTSAPGGGVVGAYGADTILLGGESTDLVAALAPISDDLIIEGGGGTISRSNGAPEFRILEITGGATVELRDLEITGGDLTLAMDVGGGILCDSTVGNDLTLTNVNVNNNKALEGGGIFTECETLIEKGSSISNNTALDLPMGMTPTAGDGGGILMDGASTGPLTIEDSAVNGNTAFFGGGLVVFAPVLVDIDNSTFNNNAAVGDGGGGAVFEETDDININRSDFNNNTSLIGAAGISVDVDGGAPIGTFTLTHSSVNNNTATGDISTGEEGALGGGIFIREHEFEINNSTIRNNRVIDDIPATMETRGGGIMLLDTNFGTNAINDSVIRQNSSTYVGGGIAAENSTVIIENSRVANNNADLGAGIAAYNGGDITVEESEITSNTAKVSGGGIFASNGAALTLDAATIAGNTAQTADGGGVVLTALRPIAALGADGAATGIVEGSTISGNTAAVSGGGIFNESSMLDILTSTVSGNNSGTGGGGVHTLAQSLAATSTVEDSTIASNSSTSGGGGFDQTDNPAVATTDLTGSLLANNTAANCNASLGGAATVTFTDSISNDDSCTLVGSGLAVTGLVNILALAENGGPTQTHAIPSTSSAVDTGHTTGAFDQRGIARPQGGDTDTGAYEFGGVFIELVDNGPASTTVAAGTTNVVMLDVALTPREGDVTLASLEGSFCAPGHVLDVTQFTVVHDADSSGSLTPGDTTLGTLPNPMDETEFEITINMGDPTILENATKNILVLANFDATIDQALAPSGWTQSAYAGPMGQAALLNSRAAQIALLLVGLLLIASFVFQGELLRKIRVLLIAGFLGVAITACSDDDDDGGDNVGETPSVVVGENGIESSANLLSSFCLKLEEVNTVLGVSASNLPVIGATVKVNN